MNAPETVRLLAWLLALGALVMIGDKLLARVREQVAQAAG